MVAQTIARALVLPNPMSGKGKVRLLGEAAKGQAILTVKDALGRTIHVQTGLSGKEFEFAGKFASGLYFLSVSESGKVLAQGRFSTE